MGLAEIRLLKEKALLPKQAKIYHIPKVSAKRAAKIKEQKDSKTDNALDKWFEERRTEMTGKCALCGGKTLKNSDDEYRRSIHHLFDKRATMFPSVSTHPDNWLEVCFYGNSCHSGFHNGRITWSLLHNSKEWEIVAAKIKKILPFIADSELRHLPKEVIEWIG